MADRFLELNNGKIAQREASDSSTGVAEAGDIIAAGPDGKLDPSFLPTGVGPDVKVLEADEALSAGDYVNIFDDGGTEKVRLADNSNGREAHGFVLEAFAAAAQATVFFEGGNTALTGLTAGQRVYLGTAGSVITTPLDNTDPGQAGNIHQLLGTAIDSTTVNTDIDDCITL